MWIRKLFSSRSNISVLHELDTIHVQNFTRMSSSDFEFLINKLGSKIGKIDTNLRKAIPVQNRVALTLRFLATGDSYTSLQYLFKISKQRIGVIVIETCTALIDVLKEHIQVSKVFIQTHIHTYVMIQSAH